VIKPDLLQSGFELVQRENLEVTDDVSIIEALGQPVRVTKGSYTNIKVPPLPRTAPPRTKTPDILMLLAAIALETTNNAYPFCICSPLALLIDTFDAILCMTLHAM
jgi:hypothetical protein